MSVDGSGGTDPDVSKSGTFDMITVSREFGSGGSDLAAELGTRLGWPVLDHELVHLVADRLQLARSRVAEMDEHPPGMLARLSSVLLMTRAEAHLPLDTREFLRPDAVADATRAVMLEAANSPPLIIVGHGSQCLFRDRPGSLHVRLVSEIDARVHRICSREPCEAATAVAQVRRMDTDRAAYVQRYYQSDWRDPMLYDIQLNTGRIGVAAATDAIVNLVHSGRD